MSKQTLIILLDLVDLFTSLVCGGRSAPGYRLLLFHP